MDTTFPELPSGEVLEREIAEIEARTHDEMIRRTLLDRIAIANDPQTVFIPHEEVFAKSRTRLMAKLAAQSND
jgi:hypothetical protein